MNVTSWRATASSSSSLPSWTASETVVFDPAAASGEYANCSTIQELSFESVDLPAIQLLFAVLYTLVWTMAIVGNALVLYVVSFAQVSLSVRSVFIGCLAVSDLLMSLTSLPVTAVSIFSRAWLFPDFFCKLIGVFQGGSIFVSSFTLTAIAIDRCFLIRRPNQEVINYERAINVVIFIWALGYALALPVGIFSRALSYEGTCGVFCEENWPDSNGGTTGSAQRKMYGLAVLLLQFGIPTLLSSVCYIAISRVMDEQLQRRRGQQLLPDAEQRLLTRRTRANRMMVYMVGGLVISWMPLNAINLYRDFSNDFAENMNGNPWFSTVFALCHVTAMMSAVVNPLIYSWFNPAFRQAVNSLVKSCTPLSSLISDTKNTEVQPLKNEIKLATSRGNGYGEEPL